MLVDKLFKYFFDILYQEYNSEGYRKHPDARFIELEMPFYANKFWGEIDWDTDEKN